VCAWLPCAAHVCAWSPCGVRTCAARVCIFAVWSMDLCSASVQHICMWHLPWQACTHAYATKVRPVSRLQKSGGAAQARMRTRGRSCCLAAGQSMVDKQPPGCSLGACPWCERHRFVSMSSSIRCNLGPGKVKGPTNIMGPRVSIQ